MSIEETVNNAITYHLSIFYNLDSIKELFGEPVAQLIDEIASFGTNDVDWADNDQEINHIKTQDRLFVKYPFLTKSSIVKIADVAAYFWKFE